MSLWSGLVDESSKQIDVATDKIHSDVPNTGRDDLTSEGRRMALPNYLLILGQYVNGAGIAFGSSANLMVIMVPAGALEMETAAVGFGAMGKRHDRTFAS